MFSFSSLVVLDFLLFLIVKKFQSNIFQNGENHIPNLLVPIIKSCTGILQENQTGNSSEQGDPILSRQAYSLPLIIQSS